MPQDRVLIVDDERVQREALRDLLTDWGYDVAEAETPESAVEAFKRVSPQIVLLDLKLGDRSGLDVLRDVRLIDPDAVVMMISGHGELDDAVAGFRLGLVDYFSKPLDLSALRVAIRYRLETRRLETEVRRWRQRDADSVNESIVGTSAALAQAFSVLRKVATSDAGTVLLLGESGTGKDLFAKALHYASPRASGPFLAVTCASSNEASLEVELFGHEKGAFPEARTLKRGAFELADQGTLYLNEIVDLSLPLQAKLQHALETRTVRRLGGGHDIPVDTRVVAASNRDLAAAVRSGRLRADLYYRLGVIQVTLPPLRERREDIPALVDAFLREYAERAGRRFTGVAPDAMAALCRHDWPGNVRELRNTVERAVILEDGDVLTMRYLSLGVPAAEADDQEPVLPGLVLPPGGTSLEVVEQDLVRQAMRTAGGNQTRAARLLGIGRDALRYKLKKFGYLTSEPDPATSREPDAHAVSDGAHRFDTGPRP